MNRSRRAGTNALYLLRKQVVRHRAALIVGGILSTVLAVATAVSLVQWSAAVDAREESERHRYVGRIALAAEAMRDARVAELRTVLEDCDERHRGWEWQYLWARSDESVLEFRASDAVTFVEVSDDGRRILTCGRDRALRLWDAESGELVQTIEAHGHDIDRACFVDAGGGLLLSASRDGSAKLFDAAGEELDSFAHPEQVFTLALGADRERFYTGDRIGTLRAWKLGRSETLFAVSAHRDAVVSIAVSPSGAMLATGSGDRTIGLWHAETGTLVRRIERSAWSDHRRPAERAHQTSMHVEFVDEETVVSTGEDGYAKLWDVATGNLLESRNLGVVLARARVDPAGERLAIAAADSVRTVRLGDGVSSRPLLGHASRSLSVAWYPDQRIASSGYDGRIRVFDLDARNGFEVLERGDGPLEDISLSADGRTMAVVRPNGGLRLWDTAELEPVRELRLAHPTRVRSAELSPAGDRVATLAVDSLVRVFDVATGRQEAEYPSRNHRFCWSESALWFVDDAGQVVRHAQGSGARVRFDSGFEKCQAIAAGGRRVAVGSADGRVRVFDPGGEPIWERQHDGSVASLGFSADGGWLAAGGWQWVAVHRAADGAEVFARERRERVIGVAFSEDAERLFGPTPARRRTGRPDELWPNRARARPGEHVGAEVPAPRPRRRPPGHRRPGGARHRLGALTPCSSPASRLASPSRAEARRKRFRAAPSEIPSPDAISRNGIPARKPRKTAALSSSSCSTHAATRACRSRRVTVPVDGRVTTRSCASPTRDSPSNALARRPALPSTQPAWSSMSLRKSVHGATGPQALHAREQARMHLLHQVVEADEPQQSLARRPP